MDSCRARRLKKFFNLTLKDYERILKFQNGVCAISGKPPGNIRLSVDHSHATGLIRGVLDWKINRALQLFNDDPNLLRRAADYLENPPATTALGKEIYGILGKAKYKKKMRYGTNLNK